MLSFGNSGSELVFDSIESRPADQEFFALIRKVHSVLISRCLASGDGYGWHVDNPFSRYGRRDLSFTVFLVMKSSYRGWILQ